MGNRPRSSWEEQALLRRRLAAQQAEWSANSKAAAMAAARKVIYRQVGDVTLQLSSLRPLTSRDVRSAVQFLMMAETDIKEVEMGERNEVTIPAGTLIHVGGLPFEIKEDTRVYGSAENLAEGLRTLTESAAEVGAGEVGATA